MGFLGEKLDLVVEVEDLPSGGLVLEIARHRGGEPNDTDLEIWDLSPEKFQHRLEIFVSGKEDQFSVAVLQNFCHYLHRN